MQRNIKHCLFVAITGYSYSRKGSHSSAVSWTLRRRAKAFVPYINSVTLAVMSTTSRSGFASKSVTSILEQKTNINTLKREFYHFSERSYLRPTPPSSRISWRLRNSLSGKRCLGLCGRLNLCIEKVSWQHRHKILSSNITKILLHFDLALIR